MSETGRHTFQQLWELVEPVVQREGLELYDIERSTSSGKKGRAGRGIIRVFLTRSSKDLGLTNGSSGKQSSESEEHREGGVTVDDCALISRRLSSIDRFEEFLGEHSVLEVSSPGINRKLRTPRHFQQAIGERVSVKAYFDDEGKEKRLTGFVLKGDDEGIIFKEEVSGEEQRIQIADISSARIDFDFSTPQKKGKKQ